MTVALMWEAKAAEGRGGELLAWVRGLGRPPGCLRWELFSAPADRVLAITWWDAPYEADLPELPGPPDALAARPPHRWRFTAVPPDGD